MGLEAEGNTFFDHSNSGTIKEPKKAVLEISIQTRSACDLIFI